MNIQSDIVDIIKKNEPEHYEIILEYLKNLENENLSYVKANERLTIKVEKLVIDSYKELEK